MTRRNGFHWITPLGMSLALAACGGGDNGNGGNGPNGDGELRINSFARSPSGPINSGETVNLTWDVTGATTVRITQNPGPTMPIYEGGDAQGTRESSPINAATTFRLTAISADDNQMREIEITSMDIQGVTIDSFELVTTGAIRAGDEITLRYELSGVTQLQEASLRDADGEVPLQRNGDPIDISLTDLEGSLTFVAEVPDGSSGAEIVQTYTLSVTGGGVSVSADEEVTISAGEPVVDVFRTTANNGRTTFYAVPSSMQNADNRVGVQWTVRNTSEVAVNYDDQPCRNFGRPGPTGCIDRPEGCEGTATCNVDLLTGEHTLTLIARSPTGSEVTEEIDITVVPDIAVNSFSITPTDFWQSEVDAQVSWNVENATDLQFQRCNGDIGQWQDVDLPGVGSGDFVVSNADFVVEATGGVTQRYRLLTTIRDGDGNLVKPTEGDLQDTECSNDEGPDPLYPETSVTAGFNEPEPNSMLEEALPVIASADGENYRGTLENINDRDWFVFDTTAGEQVYVYALQGGGCNNQIRLQAYDATGNPVTPVTDRAYANRAAPFGGCPELYGAQSGYQTLMNVPGGPMYVEVSGANIAGSAQYLVVFSKFPRLERSAAVTELMPVGTPSWSVEDIQLFSITVDQGGMNPFGAWFQALGRVLPNHATAMDQLGLVTGLSFAALADLIPEAPARSHIIPYDLEVQYGLRAFPFVGGPQIIGAQFEDEDLGIADGGMTPRDGINIMYTLVPTGTSTGTALDYQLAGNTDGGPIIPAATFPLTIEGRFAQPFDDAIHEIGAREDMDDATADGPFDLPYPGSGDMFDGVTHTHMLHIMADSFYDFGMASAFFQNELPAEITGGGDDFEWTFELRDQLGFGYDIELLIRVVPTP